MFSSLRSPLLLSAWTDGARGMTNSRTGIIQICVIVAAVALFILMKKLS